jgi:hypothetical protein
MNELLTHASTQVNLKTVMPRKKHPKMKIIRQASENLRG